MKPDWKPGDRVYPPTADQRICDNCLSGHPIMQNRHCLGVDTMCISEAVFVHQSLVHALPKCFFLTGVHGGTASSRYALQRESDAFHWAITCYHRRGTIVCCHYACGDERCRADFLGSIQMNTRLEFARTGQPMLSIQKNWPESNVKDLTHGSGANAVIETFWNHCNSQPISLPVKNALT